MPTITTVDATWDTGVTYDAAELRRADTTGFLGDGTTNGVRGGIVRHGDTSLAVAVNGSDQVTVQPGAFVVPAATGLGCYRGSLPAATSAVGLTARNGTNPRIDLVVIQIGTGSVATVKTIDGTPGSSPSAPALPAQHIEIARLNVPQVGGGAVTVDTSFRTYTTGLGGVLPVESAARLPGSGNQKNQRATALDTGLGWVWDGTAWVPDVPLGAWTTYTPVLTASTTNPTLGSGSTATGRTMAIGKMITAHYRIVFGSSGMAAGTGTYLISLPVPPSTAWSNRLVGTGLALDVSANNLLPLILRVNGTASTLVMQFPATWPGGAASNLTHVNMYTWATGDELHGSITYEAA